MEEKEINKEEPLGKLIIHNIDLLLVLLIGIIVLIFDLVYKNEYRVGLALISMSLGSMGYRGYISKEKSKLGLTLFIVCLILIIILITSYILTNFVGE